MAIHRTNYSKHMKHSKPHKPRNGLGDARIVLGQPALLLMEFVNRNTLKGIYLGSQDAALMNIESGDYFVRFTF